MIKLLVKADRLPGGRADRKHAEDFDADDLAEGQKHEREHTADDDIAREIAMDHLAEDPDYYRKLAKLEKGTPIKGKPGLHLDPLKHRWVLNDPRAAKLLAPAAGLPDDPAALLEFFTRVHKAYPRQAIGALKHAQHAMFPDEVAPPDPTDDYLAMTGGPHHLARSFRTHTAVNAAALRAMPDHWEAGGEYARARDAHKAAQAAEEAREAAYQAQGVEVEVGSAPPLAKLRGKQVWLYHGTSSALLDEIRERGLWPGRQVGKRSNVGSASDLNKWQHHVYLTADSGSGPAGARDYARLATARHGGDPVVLRLLVNGDELSMDRDDADIASGRHQYRIDHVPPSAIMEIDGERVGQALVKAHVRAHRRKGHVVRSYTRRDPVPVRPPTGNPYQGQRTMGAGEYMVRLVTNNVLKVGTWSEAGLRFEDVRLAGIAVVTQPGPHGGWDRHARVIVAPADLGSMTLCSAGIGVDRKTKERVIIVKPNSRFTLSEETWGEELRQVIAHELVHLADPQVALDGQANSPRASTGDRFWSPSSDKEWHDYVNHRPEVWARRHEIFRELNDERLARMLVIMAQRPKEFPMHRLVMLGLTASKTWQEIRDVLDPPHRRRIMAMAAALIQRHVAGTSTPMQKGEG